MSQSMASLILPTPPSWYPGHMRQFLRNLPALLGRTDVVLELRDSRLPLTSINGTFEGVLQKWRHERQILAQKFLNQGPAYLSSSAPSLRGHSSLVCEHIVVMNKRDLVPEWGIEPFQRAIESRFPNQRTIFASWNRPKDVKNLHETIVNIAQDNAHVSNELNVLVVGMPNVGKSTLLNALRNMGIPGPTPKALRTSANPGLTRALSTRLKLSQEPLVYSYDSPGVMLPFMGKGDLGAERGIKLALIAGIRAGLYPNETLAEYLLYQLNLLNPLAPAYLSILPPGSPPTDDVFLFLDLLAERLNMLKRGGERDLGRASEWFIRWWREEGCAMSSNAPFLTQEGLESEAGETGHYVGSPLKVLDSPDAVNEVLRQREASLDVQRGAKDGVQRGGWGFDFQWELSTSDVANARKAGADMQAIVQREMERVIDEYAARVEEESKEGGDVSSTQLKKREKEIKKAKREKRIKEMLERRRSGKK